MNLNLGCGRDVRDGWVNIDLNPTEPNVIHANFEEVTWYETAGLKCSQAHHSEASHLIEHLEHPLRFMEGLWWATRHDGTVLLKVPYGSSDDAWEDPTHRRPYFVGSWGYFSQPYYWRADYGYRGDWAVEKIQLVLRKGVFFQADDDAFIRSEIEGRRNVVQEMRALLRCVKPARPAERSLQDRPEIEYVVQF